MEYTYEKRIRNSVELELFRDGRHFREYDAEVIKELKEVYAKAKAFDEVKKFALNMYEELELRKVIAGNGKSFDYFNALQASTREIINKFKELEDK